MANQLYGEFRYADSYITFMGESDGAFRALWAKNGFTHKSERFEDFKQAGVQFSRWVKQVISDATIAVVHHGGVSC